MQFMLRLKNPCGKVDAATYKCIDELSEKYGQQDLRATTRQAFQVGSMSYARVATAQAMAQAGDRRGLAEGVGGLAEKAIYVLA